MNTHLHGLSWSLVVCLCTVFCLGCSDDDGPAADAGLDAAPSEAGADGPLSDAPPTGPRKLIILHTNDLHAHLLGHGPNVDYSPDTTDDDATRGGYARLAALIKKERAAAGDTPVLLLDAGDVSMGSAFNWLNFTTAPALTLLQTMGYDAITLGNHEMEWGPQGLAAMIGAALGEGFQVPILASNLTFDATDSGDDTLEALAASGAIVTKLVKELPGGLKVGVLGVLGKDAAALAPSRPVSFEPEAEAAKAVATELRDQDQVDLVLALSHTGVPDEDGDADDPKMAEAVPEIDVIISGHSHTLIEEPMMVGETVIVQAGRYGEHLGRLELTVEGGKVTVDSYTVIPVDDSIEGDAEMIAAVDGHIAEIDAMLQPRELSLKQVFAQTDYDLIKVPFEEYTTGNLVTDAYRAAHDAVNPSDPAVIAFEGSGIVRDNVLAGETGQLWLADLIRVLPNGIGPDKQPGWPLVSFYITGKEIKNGFEMIPLSQSPLLFNYQYFMQISGARVEYQKDGPFLNSVTRVTVGDPPQEIDLADTTTCYKVVTSITIAELLSLAAKATSGVLKVEGKLSDCQTVITDMTTRIIDADPTTPGLQELKSWQAMLQHVSSFPDTDGDSVPNLPAEYAQTQGRIVAQ